MHKSTDPAHPAPRRHGSVALISNERGDVLLVDPRYRAGWQLPGGHAMPGEDHLAAAVREVAEETGLVIAPTRVLAIDYVSATATSAEGLNVVFDGGTVPAGTPIGIQTDELDGCRWVPLDDLANYTVPEQAARIRRAHAVRAEGGGIPFLRRGQPVG